MPHFDYHIPVMAEACIDALQIKGDGVYVDATFGGGGHSKLILEKLGPKGKLIAFDQDPDAILNQIQDPRFILVNHNFKYLKNFLKFHQGLPADGVLADLGVSSHQLDSAEKGFSYRFQGPLDMRMDPETKISAWQVINEYDAESLFLVFKKFGELPDARKITKTIIAARQKEFIHETTKLVAILKNIAPLKSEYSWLSQVFQAIRIEVNAEMENLEIFLIQAAKVLKPNGRLVVLTYHSLEDRMVKKLIKEGSLQGQAVRDAFGNAYAWFNHVTLPNRPESLEIEKNNRSRSAHLRVGQRTEYQNNWI